MTAAICVHDLTYAYRPGGRRILDGINLTLQPGETLALLGGGKSTLCLALCGLIPHSLGGVMEGEVSIFGTSTRALTPARLALKVGIVFQNPEHQLFLPRIRNELAFAPENLCRPPVSIREAVGAAAAELGITELLPANPNALSGGQQQLAVLASVFCQDPDILILDEVLSQLDAANTDIVLAALRRRRERGKTLVLVDHRPAHLTGADQRLALIDGRLIPAEPTGGSGEVRP